MSVSMSLASRVAPRAARGSPRSRAARTRDVRIAAGKFTKIGDAAGSSDAGASGDARDAPAPPKLEILGRVNDDGELAHDDDELPDNLFDAVATAAIATEQAIDAGSLGNLVELRIPELWDPISGNVMAEAGDQLKVWEITREYVTQLADRVGPDRRVKAVFPDAGCAALLKARWPDANFAFASANDRIVYEDRDAILVFAAPDPPSLESVRKASRMANENGAAVVLINPRLASGDAGLGLNFRRMREEFLGKMTVVYCVQPLPWCNGNIFKRFPGLWRLYLQDETRPGRFKLVKESPQRLAGDDLDDVVMREFRPKGEDGEEKEAGPVEKVFGVFASLQRFANSLR
jgi:hypothetical protein